VKHVALITSLLLLSITAWGQTYSNANLNGNYSVNFGSPQNYSWSKTFTCPTQSQISHTVNGSQTGMNVGSGVVAFDGIGGLSLTFTSTGRENQTASANTTSVTWNSSCQVVSQNNGHVVFQAATTKTQTGTYSIQSNGTGTMSETGSSDSQSLLLAATSNGVSATVLMSNPQVNGKTMGIGIAVHQ
jgi:hypothetical protein